MLREQYKSPLTELIVSILRLLVVLQVKVTLVKHLTVILCAQNNIQQYNRHTRRHTRFTQKHGSQWRESDREEEKDGTIGGVGEGDR